MKAREILKRAFDLVGGRYLLDRLDGFSNNDMAKRGMIRRAFLFTLLNQVDGDYLEFGVYRGDSFLMAHRMKRRLHLDQMKLWAFDSFAGLPSIDNACDNTWNEGQYACTLQEFQRILRTNGVRRHEYDLVPGYYDASLNDRLHARLAGRKAAIVYVDCDLYTSTVPVLNFVQRYLQNGTIVCFDDFYHYKGSPEQGEQRALAEFLRDRPAFNFIPWADYSPVGKSFIVRVGVGQFDERSRQSASQSLVQH